MLKSNDKRTPSHELRRHLVTSIMILRSSRDTEVVWPQEESQYSELVNMVSAGVNAMIESDEPLEY